MSFFIFSNLAISLDGKIAPVGRGHFPLGTDEDRKQMQVLRRQCDAILMGASTVRAYRKPCKVLGAAPEDQPFNLILSRNLEGVSPLWPFFQDSGMKRIIFLTGTIPAPRLNAFLKTSEVHFLKPATQRNPVSFQILKILKKKGIQRLLVEGGGEVMWSFASKNLIEEYHVTVTPRVLGGARAPTLVDGEGFSPRESLNLKLLSCRQVGDELFLIYKKTAKRG